MSPLTKEVYEPMGLAPPFFGALGALLLIVRRGERLTFESIGWKGGSYGRSLLWGLLTVITAHFVVDVVPNVLLPLISG